MGIGSVAEAETIDLWEYEALLVHWNRAQGGESADPETDLDPEKVQAQIDRINSDPRLTGAKVPA